MEHVAGLPSSASRRVLPGALTLAVLLHLLAGLGIWAITSNQPAAPPVEEAIDVTIEAPKRPDPPPPKPEQQPPPQAQPKPQPKAQPAPPLQGLPPPAEITADRRTQVPPSGDRPKDIASPTPRSLDEPVAQPEPPVQAATSEPPKPPDPPPPIEQVIPPPTSPATAVASLPPPPKEPAAALQQPATPKSPVPAPAVTTIRPEPPRPQTPPAITPNSQARPSPLVGRPQDRPPAVADRGTPPSSSPFVNPADVRNRALVGDNYRWQIIRKLSGYRFTTQAPVGEAHLVMRIDIARDGRLLAAAVVQSSGVPAIDQGALDGIRSGSPYTPLPPEIGGDSASFTLPLTSVPVGGRR